MKVTILQTDISWGNTTLNQFNVESIIEKLPQTDMYVLPEMWSTGFVIVPSAIAEDEEESLRHGSLAWMKKIAEKTDAAICGSLAVRLNDGTYANRMYFVYPDGKTNSYNKRHLFSPGGEDRSYKAGKERCIVKFRGVRFLLQICYDLRFPVWSRNQGDYDAIIYVANWPAPRHDVWATLLRARALENQCYVIGVNRTGDDEACTYKGGSVIITPYGKIAAQCNDNIEDSATGEIDMVILDKFRDSFPVHNDRDLFVLNP